MRAEVLYCPHLGRDISALQATVPDLHVLIGERTPKGEDGCLEGHKTIIRQAQAAGASRVWALEDDCEFTPNFSLAQWEADADWAEAHGYDVLVGGSTRTYDERLVRQGMIEVEAFHSAHCVVYFQSGYEKALQAVQPYDLSLGRDCKLRCVLVYPFVAVQKPSFSGILQYKVDYVPLYHGHETELRDLLGLSS